MIYLLIRRDQGDSKAFRILGHSLDKPKLEQNALTLNEEEYSHLYEVIGPIHHW